MKKKVYAKTLHIPIWGNDCFEVELYAFPTETISMTVSKGRKKVMSQDIEFGELVALRDAFIEMVETYSTGDTE